ncbi:alpha/beta fold hydrolase [Actinokineospora sp. UTMC 2448]|uniref:alpha/beta fold hydrolase n=1 Tax=Actinokineospora sp. UTMC 2448 TaxID=2268449 RepID=UPI0021649281|nr:alpha/beta hydrolase [Actinokineospora sp. UTMC 2448]UVS79836.1 Tropinesterase [Actinokineospora sp. UTMC 2448]
MNAYAPVNGLRMYYEIHGSGDPVVLLHGALSGIETSFGALLPLLAKNRQVIAVEFQGHGRTADVDRPLTYPQLADDVAALLRHIGVDRADVLGYSMGGGIALELAMRHPDAVRKLVLASVTYTVDGCHPGLFEGMAELTPDMLVGTPFEEEYLRLAPDPQAFPALVEKVKGFDLSWRGWSEEAVRAITAPTMVLIGDSDLARPEHAVEMFRLFGGGVFGDVAGLPDAQLAVLPGTTHVGITQRAEWIAPMVDEFLDR